MIANVCFKVGQLIHTPDGDARIRAITTTERAGVTPDVRIHYTKDRSKQHKTVTLQRALEWHRAYLRAERERETHKMIEETLAQCVDANKPVDAIRMSRSHLKPRIRMTYGKPCPVLLYSAAAEIKSLPFWKKKTARPRHERVFNDYTARLNMAMRGEDPVSERLGGDSLRIEMMRRALDAEFGPPTPNLDAAGIKGIVLNGRDLTVESLQKLADLIGCNVIKR